MNSPQLSFVDKGYPEFDWVERDEAEVGFFGFVVAGGDSAPVLQLVEQPLDQVLAFDLRSLSRNRGDAPLVGRTTFSGMHNCG